MDITSLYHINSKAIKEAASQTRAERQAAYDAEGHNLFSTMLSDAIGNLNTANSYYSDMENEELKLMLGQTNSTHDLTIAMQKAYESLQYTVAVRDKILDAYKEIMQMQI